MFVRNKVHYPIEHQISLSLCGIEKKIGVIHMMRWVIDLMLLAVLLLCAFNGYRKGILMEVGAVVCLLISLHGALDDQRLFWLFFFLLAVGAASRIAMGLSPTVWASGERTCFYLYVCMATVLGNLVRSLFEIKEFVS